MKKNTQRKSDSSRRIEFSRVLMKERGKEKVSKTK